MASLDDAFKTTSSEFTQATLITDDELGLVFTWQDMVTCIAKQNNLNSNPELYVDLHNGPINGHLYLWYKPTNELYSHPVNRNVHRCI